MEDRFYAVVLVPAHCICWNMCVLTRSLISCTICSSQICTTILPLKSVLTVLLPYYYDLCIEIGVYDENIYCDLLWFISLYLDRHKRIWREREREYSFFVPDGIVYTTRQLALWKWFPGEFVPYQSEQVASHELYIQDEKQAYFSPILFLKNSRELTAVSPKRRDLSYKNNAYG